MGLRQHIRPEFLRLRFFNFRNFLKLWKNAEIKLGNPISAHMERKTVIFRHICQRLCFFQESLFCSVQMSITDIISGIRPVKKIRKTPFYFDSVKLLISRNHIFRYPYGQLWIIFCTSQHLLLYTAVFILKFNCTFSKTLIKFVQPPSIHFKRRAYTCLLSSVIITGSIQSVLKFRFLPDNFADKTDPASSLVCKVFRRMIEFCTSAVNIVAGISHILTKRIQLFYHK